ncbi:ATP-binding protein [Cellulomonas fengjieae]|uniref:DNA topoisomerase (ATP-hydrolyzing) n=1 Tax=Cellulomonas fengjieae TaxID=2819978 RepID=A0ABS3SKY4_9CELL|nr:ATP-binding protein [Cellulomonas fengjieae]MBO3086342.1 ATP-binding protein [Cellulomonas fengjieae]MBO3102254.1 ATP-binding protein [Cellulomonas fengjieae]QVI65623.1 ATP-binding protein [Cellulomonas fengjieae]
MSDRASWVTTTHAWSSDLDLAHLAEIRSRPTLYGAGGRRHLILEVLAYANEEAESRGRMGHAVVTMRADGTVTVADDGRGTDTRIDEHGDVIRKPVMSTRDVRFFDAEDGARLPDGLPRRGMSVVSAMSPVLVHENHLASGAWSQTYRRGVPDDELRAVTPSTATGTSVTFRVGAEVQGPESLVDSDLTGFPALQIDLR